MEQARRAGSRLGAGILLISILWLVGCGGGGSAGTVGTGAGTGAVGVNTRSLVVTEPTPITVGQDRVDSLSAVGFDASGNVVYGPVVVDFNEYMLFRNFPATVSTVQLDYLRFHGYPLARWTGSVQDAGIMRPRSATRATATTASDGSPQLDDPDQQVVTGPQSAWKVLPTDTGGFRLQVTHSGALPASLSPAPTSFRIKGVCYSPTPINASNKNGPNIGDVFWDTFSGVNAKNEPYTVYNWYSLWGTGNLYADFYARADLDRMRGLGSNTIRVYSMISRQLEDSNQSFPSPPAGQHFTHKQFLDMCWNGGKNPLYVLVDIPMPAPCFQKTSVATPGQIAWWEAVLAETVDDLKDHPAVIGFNIFNEQDSAEAGFPNVGQGPATANTDYYYENCSRYADLVKRTAPNKLVGWGLHDVPDFVIFASRFGSPDPAKAARGVYMDWLSSFDYWGINTYQTQNFSSIVGPGMRGSYADLAGSQRKPVLLTELGWPATGHQDGALVDNAQTRANTARTITAMFPLVYANDLFLGAYYFEFCDEWWKQPGYAIDTWDPGPPQPGFPNGFTDEEGFGLFAVARDGGRSNSDDPWAGSGPTLPTDRLTARTEMVDALKRAWASVRN